MEGYLLEVECRDGKERGGGVGAYVRSNLKYVVKDYTVKHTKSTWFEINNGEFQKVMVSVLYRNPNTDVKEFQESLLTVLEDIKVDRRNTIIIGDFNINSLISDGTNRRVFNSDEMRRNGAKNQKIQRRVTSESVTLLDHIYTNMNKYDNHSGVIECDISDHYPVFMILENPCSLKQLHYPQTVTYRCYKKL